MNSLDAKYNSALDAKYNSALDAKYNSALDINISSISDNIRNRKNELIKQSLEAKRSQEFKQDMLVKNSITNVIEKDIVRIIELEEKQKNLIKYHEIIAEEERKRRAEEEKEKFKQQCQSIIEYENSYVKRYVFKFFVWIFIAYVVYCYFKSFFDLTL